MLQIWTGGINEYLGSHASAADALLIAHSFLGDAVIIFLFAISIRQATVRPILPLFLLLVLRQLLQITVSLPLSSGLIWRYPGFPSLFSNYSISGDFYFSAYVGIGILGMAEAVRSRKKWPIAALFALVLFQAFADIVLRSHYTTDVYTSIVTAIAVSLASRHLYAPIERLLKQTGEGVRPLLLFLIVLGTAGYFLSENAIGNQPIPDCGIDDAILSFFEPLNRFFHAHPGLADAQLIAMNTLMDAMTLMLAALSVWKRNIRPYLALGLFFFFRQMMQILISLPLPPEIIWHYPGFPSLFQTYQVSNDLYFSGHTGISLIAACELARFNLRWLTALGFSLFAYELISVIGLSIHYTMDVYTAIVTVFCVNALSKRAAGPVNGLLASLRYAK